MFYLFLVVFILVYLSVGIFLLGIEREKFIDYYLKTNQEKKYSNYLCNVFDDYAIVFILFYPVVYFLEFLVSIWNFIYKEINKKI